MLGEYADATAPDDIYDMGDLASEFPVFASVVRAAATADQARAEIGFGMGLDCLIVGLVAWQGRHRSAVPATSVHRPVRLARFTSIGQ